jgi:hypothetical protein
MPEILNPDIQRAFCKETSDKEGEEGVIRFTDSSKKKQYALKEWKGHHGVKSILYESEAEKSPTSPYFFKCVFYEGKLTHGLFPGETLDIVAAMDPRIQKEDDDWDIYSILEKGRPLTISKKVEGDEKLQQERDQVMSEIMAEIFAGYRYDKNGVGNLQNFSSDKLAEYEERLVNTLGRKNFDFDISVFYPDDNCLDEPQHHVYTNIDYDKILEKMRQGGISSDDILYRLFESGILPKHWQFNFLPVKKEGQNTKGVVIESQIIDTKRLQKKIEEQPELEKKQLLGYLERYRLYYFLDNFYKVVYLDEITNSLKYHEGRDIPDDLQLGPLRDSLFALLEDVRDILEKNSGISRQRIYEDFQHRLSSTLRLGSKATLVDRIERRVEQLERTVAYFKSLSYRDEKDNKK